MAQNHGVRNDEVVYTCPIFGCGAEIVLLKSQQFAHAFCENCYCPMWPLELGFTGNDPADVREYARNHAMPGLPAIAINIERHIARLNREGRRRDTKQKISRLAELNIRALHGSLTKTEEVEREFLNLTLPHASNMGRFSDLLKKLVVE